MSDADDKKRRTAAELSQPRGEGRRGTSGGKYLTSF